MSSWDDGIEEQVDNRAMGRKNLMAQIASAKQQNDNDYDDEEYGEDEYDGEEEDPYGDGNVEDLLDDGEVQYGNFNQEYEQEEEEEEENYNANPHGYQKPPEFAQSPRKPMGIPGKKKIQPPPFKKKKIEPPSFQKKKIEPPSFQKKKIEPPSFQKKRIEPPSFQKKKIEPPSFKKKIPNLNGGPQKKNIPPPREKPPQQKIQQGGWDDGDNFDDDNIDDNIDDDNGYQHEEQKEQHMPSQDIWEQKTNVRGTTYGDTTEDYKETKADVILRECIDKEDSYTILKFGENSFSTHKKSLFKKMTNQELMTFTLKKFKKSILKSCDKLNAQALQSFRNITGYMGDRKSSKTKTGHVQKLVRNALDSGKELMNEIFLQIIKQITGNPKRESCLSGWKLLSVLVGIFPPTRQFAPYLYSFIKTVGQKASDSQIKEIAAYSIPRLKSSLNNGPRTREPVGNEIQAIEGRKPFPFRIAFLDSTFKTLKIESQTNCMDVCKKLCKKLKLGNPRSFGLFQLATDRGKFVFEKPLETTTRIMDVVAHWFAAHKKSKELNPKSDLRFKMMFKVKLFLESEINSDLLQKSESLHMYYTQAVYDVLTNFFPLTDQDAHELAGYQIQSQFGGDNPGNRVKKKLHRYLPQHMIPKKEKKADQVLASVFACRQNCINLSKEQAKWKYVSKLSKYPLYGSILFSGKQCSDSGKRNEDVPVLLGVSERGLFILDRKKRADVKCYKMDLVKRHAFSGSYFVVECGEKFDEKEIKFQTYWARNLNHLLHEYRVSLGIQTADSQGLVVTG